MKSKQADWFEYDWKLDGEAARYGVELTLYDGAPNPRLPWLFIASASPLSAQSEAFSAPELRRVEALQKKCAAILPAFAGKICTKTQILLYFYGPNEKLIKQLDELELKEKKLLLRTGCQQDAEWNTYFHVLYPDAAKYQTESNRKSIGLYREKGDILSAPRRVVLHVAFPAEPLRVQFAEEARLSGFAIGNAEYMPESELPFGVSLQKVLPLEKAVIDAATTLAIHIAEKYEGTLTHWGCQLVPKKRPLT